jgi:adenosylhomocysteine nucleosidase
MTPPTAPLAGFDSGTDPRRVLILAALHREVRPFLRQVQARPLNGLKFPAWEFSLGQDAGIVALTGMGDTPARVVAAAALARWRPGLLISAGFAGALTPDVAPGDLVLGESCWRYDPKHREVQWAAAPAPPVPVPRLVQQLRQAGVPALAGSLVATPHVLFKEYHYRELMILRYPALDVETGVLAELAAAAGLPFLGLRAVTDGDEDEMPEMIREKVAEGREPTLAEALRWAAIHPGRLALLFRLWRRSVRAAAVLARGLTLLLPLLLASGQEH